MRIIHVAAEMAPIAKVGGLADVILGLSREQIAEGHTVEVILPKYAFLKPCNQVLGVPVTFLEIPGYFTGRLYGGKNEAISYLLFCQAAVDYLRDQGLPDVVHLHDWHAAAAALLLGKEAPTVLTIHNFAYQGECTAEDVALIGLKRAGKVNLLKEGIQVADRVTTVSPTYAKELQEQEPLLRTAKITGILNGLDLELWNPKTDPYLPSHPKQALRKQLGLADEPRMIVSTITRLVPQKGPELLKEALTYTLEHGGQFVLLGSLHDPQTEKTFLALRKEYANNPHVYLEFNHDEALAHLIYAASDLFLVPSIFEPCGLTQLIAMHYGALPLVRRTGGLADTVHEGVNGFTFGPPTRKALHEALKRAMTCWEKTPDVWQAMRMQGLKEDFSWHKSASTYLSLYRALVAEAQQRSLAMRRAESEAP